MYALSMYEEYLIDILKENRICDVRLYPTNIRGKIALLKCKTNLIYGYVDLISISQITYDEYVYWHIGERYSKEDALFEIESNNAIEKKYTKAFAYNFKNPVLFDIPKKIEIINKTGSWIEFDETKIQDGYIRQKLF